MTAIYLDLITTILYFMFTGYFLWKGIPVTKVASHFQIQKLNQLVYRNYWLFVLPFFYSITLISNLENYLSVKSFANQIVYFFLILLIQILIFLKIQPLPILVYVLRLKDYSQQFHRKFFKVNTDKEGNELENNLKDRTVNTPFGINQVSFLLNSFAMPLLLILTNSYFSTKIIYLILTFKI
ncbi:MAG: hypothetical protein RLZZ306_2758 [Bacteroidota bacterium]|jgi:hypothetical protein